MHFLRVSEAGMHLRSHQMFILALYLAHHLLTYLLMPCPFTGPKMFWAGPNLLCQTKHLLTYCGSHKHFVPDKKMICIQ